MAKPSTTQCTRCGGGTAHTARLVFAGIRVDLVTCEAGHVLAKVRGSVELNVFPGTENLGNDSLGPSASAGFQVPLN